MVVLALASGAALVTGGQLNAADIADAPAGTALPEPLPAPEGSVPATELGTQEPSLTPDTDRLDLAAVDEPRDRRLVQYTAGGEPCLAVFGPTGTASGCGGSVDPDEVTVNGAGAARGPDGQALPDSGLVYGTVPPAATAVRLDGPDGPLTLPVTGGGGAQVRFYLGGYDLGRGPVTATACGADGKGLATGSSE